MWGGISDTSFMSQQEMQAMSILLFHSVNDGEIPYERSSHPEARQQSLHGSLEARISEIFIACGYFPYLKGLRV